MTQKTQEIITYFQQLDEQRGNIVRDTSKGIFGTSDVNVMNEFFKEIKLDTAKTFIDLGSGDGRVVLLAAEYTTAIGIEADEDLVKESNEHKKQLHSQAEFLCQDYEDYDYTNIDVLFCFSDHFFTDTFISQLKKEFKGIMYIYEGVFLPEGVYKGKTYWINQTKIISYSFSQE